MNLKNAALIAVKDCMGLKEGERFLVITDTALKNIGEVLYQVGVELGSEAMYMEILPRSNDGEEPPEAVAEALLNVDVALIPTLKSMSHTMARRRASESGVRIATLPGITEDMMVRTLNVDYQQIKELSEKIAAILTKAVSIKVTSRAGTEIVFSVKNREGHADTGINHQPGSFSNLPAGEAYIAPVEGKAEGRIVIDGSLAGYGMLKSPLVVHIEKGRVAALEGDGADYLKEVFRKYGDDARNLAEFGIGTNPMARITGKILEDEKVMGTVHFAFGDNSTFGGNVSVDSHLDGLVKEPTIEIDDIIIMNRGVFTIE